MISDRVLLSSWCNINSEFINTTYIYHLHNSLTAYKNKGKYLKYFPSNHELETLVDLDYNHLFLWFLQKPFPFPGFSYYIKISVHGRLGSLKNVFYGSVFLKGENGQKIRHHGCNF